MKEPIYILIDYEQLRETYTDIVPKEKDKFENDLRAKGGIIFTLAPNTLRLMSS